MSHKQRPRRKIPNLTLPSHLYIAGRQKFTISSAQIWSRIYIFPVLDPSLLNSISYVLQKLLQWFQATNSLPSTLYKFIYSSLRVPKRTRSPRARNENDTTSSATPPVFSVSSSRLVQIGCKTSFGAAGPGTVPFDRHSLTVPHSTTRALELFI